MKVRMTFEFDDAFRKALAAHYGEPGKATREMVAAWIDSLVSAGRDDVEDDYAMQREEP